MDGSNLIMSDRFATFGALLNTGQIVIGSGNTDVDVHGLTVGCNEGHNFCALPTCEYWHRYSIPTQISHESVHLVIAELENKHASKAMDYIQARLRHFIGHEAL